MPLLRYSQSGSGFPPIYEKQMSAKAQLLCVERTLLFGPSGLRQRLCRLARLREDRAPLQRAERRGASISVIRLRGVARPRTCKLKLSFGRMQRARGATGVRDCAARNCSLST